ncbi:MAG: Rieske 2Fe-2S domain-containing protein [Pseudomonadota bacterium]
MKSDFTFWGHNCFLVETDSEALLIDPWLNDTGAFFGSWHQWPPNGHLREAVRKRCAEKSLSIFLSHEHQDHFDQATLRVLASHPDCTVFIPEYKDKFLRDALHGLNLRTVELPEGQQAGAEIGFRVFIDDSGINHDSAIFVAAPGFTFFNQNDCKLFDRLPMLKKELGKVDYYSVQFSGANWHPACFDLPEEQRRQLARKKVLSKLRNVLGGIKTLAPRFYVPAAGPAFFPFLAPALSSGEGNIFVHQDELHKYLLQNAITNTLYLRPGERVGEDTTRAPVTCPTADQLRRYRASHRNAWDDVADNFSKERFEQVLRRRLAAIADIALPPETPSLAFNWGPGEDDWLQVDLVGNALVPSATPRMPCEIVKASTRYFSLMCGEERWQDIALSLQASVQRIPDVYNTIANIFLFADESNLAESLVQNLNLPTERIVIAHQGQRYEINRYCPHQGGDLAYASIDEDMNVVCPRHSWRFDLGCEGMCKTSAMSINAVRLEKAD